MTPVLTLADVSLRVRQHALNLAVPDGLMPTYGTSRDGALPHVEVDGRGYHYVVVERGRELQRVTTPDIDELLYCVFESITFSLAAKAASARNAVTGNYRRGLFARQVELLESLSAPWAARKAADHQRTLLEHPFDDAGGGRAGTVGALFVTGSAAAASEQRDSARPLPSPVAAYRIFPSYPDTLVYDEGDGRTIAFGCLSLAEPPRVSVPSAARWAAGTPEWARGQRETIIGRLRAARCVVFEAGETLTTIVSPDGAFRIESGRRAGEEPSSPGAIRILVVPSETALYYLPGYAVVDAAGFDAPGRVDLWIRSRSGAIRSVRIDLYARSYRLPPAGDPRPLDMLREGLEVAAVAPPPLPTRRARVQPRPRPAVMLRDAAAAAGGGGALAVGGVWLAFAGRSAGDRSAGAVGALVFGTCAYTGVASLARAGTFVRRAGTAGAPPSGWVRLAPYAPLVAAVAEAPWIVVCVLFLLFLVGDQPFRSTPATDRLFQVAIALPSGAGLLLGLVFLGLGWVRTPAQRVFFALGMLLCGLFIGAVGAGWIR
ncbi:MAG: hypothetical protein JWO31_358 [Phycisphaerales bacterium]|nr:hypothetical protein [Phycisphaerales bacterium]